MKASAHRSGVVSRALRIPGALREEKGVPLPVRQVVEGWFLPYHRTFSRTSRRSIRDSDESSDVVERSSSSAAAASFAASEDRDFSTARHGNNEVDNEDDVVDWMSSSISSSSSSQLFSGILKPRVRSSSSSKG